MDGGEVAHRWVTGGLLRPSGCVGGWVGRLERGDLNLKIHNTYTIYQTSRLDTHLLLVSSESVSVRKSQPESCCVKFLDFPHDPPPESHQG